MLPPTTSAVLELYFRFQLWPYYRNLHANQCQAANFYPNRPFTAEKLRHINFQDDGRQPCWVGFRVIADHPRSVFCGLNSVLKSIVALFDSSGDIAIYRFRRFGLKMPIHAAFWGVFGAYFPCMTSHIVMDPKSTVFWRKQDVWFIQHKNQCDDFPLIFA